MDDLRERVLQNAWEAWAEATKRGGQYVEPIVDAVLAVTAGEYDRGRLDVLREAQRKAAESRDVCLRSDLHDEEAVRHWAATSGWLRHAVARMERGDEPFWDDQARGLPD